MRFDRNMVAGVLRALAFSNFTSIGGPLRAVDALIPRLRGEGYEATIGVSDADEFETYIKLPKYRVDIRIDRGEIERASTINCVDIVETAFLRAAAKLRGRVIRILADEAGHDTRAIDWDYSEENAEADERLASWLIEQGERLMARVKRAA